MTKTNSFYILPVLTKSDKLDVNLEDPDNKLIANKVKNLIQEHLKSRLDDIKSELAEIELLPSISASHSERLKHLVQTQNNLTPEIYEQFQTVSSIKKKGIEKLSKTIQEIVLSNTKRYPSVNNKVPTFWSEVEQYTLNVLSKVPKTKSVNGVIKLSKNSLETQMSILSIDYESYRKKVIDKYGMSHLVDAITKYLSSSGKIIWFQETEKRKQKIFLRPNVLFDLIFVLFRTEFNDNFSEDHVQTLRVKLVKESIDMSKENVDLLKKNLLNKGHLSMDLLNLIWYPILITDSSDLVREVILLFSSYFNFCYPDLEKEKLRLLFIAREVKKDGMDTQRAIDESQSFFDFSQITFTTTKFTKVIVPFFLPLLTDTYELNKMRDDLVLQNKAGVEDALAKKIKKEKPVLIAKLAYKYVFPWGLMSGVFEKFSTCCIINSDLYYKHHYKNFILAYNESNTIGVLIYTNSVYGLNKENNQKDEVIFEFYLLSYTKIIEQLQLNISIKAGDPSQEFDHTLTMDLDHLWVAALKILQLFEETVSSSYPNLRFDRLSMCPECDMFTFFGEWNTPKELQKNKQKECRNCHKIIDYSFLVKPTTGQNSNLDVTTLRQRLNNFADFKLQEAKYNKLHKSNASDMS